MGARQVIPIQTRAITVATADSADGGGVTRDCIVWHSKRMGYRAMYVDDVAMDVCEVPLTDATDPECCTGKKDCETCIPVSMLHKRELLATLRAHEASMPHLSAVCERVQAAVDSRDASKAPEPTARSPSLEALMRSLQRDADGRICMEFPVPEGHVDACISFDARGGMHFDAVLYASPTGRMMCGYFRKADGTVVGPFYQG